jgi:SNF2 family DNA or RNA helicase
MPESRMALLPSAIGNSTRVRSVGLGKTFEALAIIKYHELRNDRVLVLAPKRLRDNWTLYKSNDVRNMLAPDRLNYDVLNHTDLGREGGHSGDINLAHVNWGNYDLVVIDESHNFRNKPANKGKEIYRQCQKCSLSRSCFAAFAQASQKKIKWPPCGSQRRNQSPVGQTPDGRSHSLRIKNDSRTSKSAHVSP